MKKVLVQALSLLSAVTILACHARKGPEVEGGGGTIVFHSREKVIEILNQVWAQFAINRLDNPLVRAYTDVDYKKDPESLYVTGVLRKITGFAATSLPRLRDEPEFLEQLPFMSFLGGKKLKLLEAGYCDSPEHKRAAASVSKLDQSGEVCISLPALMQSATSGLRADLVALMAHEIAHLYGYGETDAQRFQRYFLDRMAVILRTDGQATKNRYLKDVKQITSQWRIILHYDAIPRPGPDEMRLSRDLKGLRYRVPRPYGEDDLQLARPELYSKVWQLATEASTQYDAFIRDLKGRIDQNALLPTDEKTFGEMRRIGLLMLDFEVAANTYVDGDNADFVPALERYLFDEATQTPLVSDPAKRFCIEDRRQLELTGPLGQKTCRDLEARLAAKKAREEGAY